MPVPVSHIIRHAQLNLHVAGGQSGMGLQREAQGWMDSLFDLLGPELDLLAGNEKWLSLDALNIEIAVQGENWQEDALRQVKTRILDTIRLYANYEIEGNGFSISAPTMHFANAFLYYLQHGRLPWNINPRIRENWKEEIRALFEKAEPSFAGNCAALLKHQIPARQRMARALGPVELVNWLLVHSESIGGAGSYLSNDLAHFATFLPKEVFANFKTEWSEWVIGLWFADETKRQIIPGVALQRQSHPVMAKAFMGWAASSNPQSQPFIQLKENLFAIQKTKGFLKGTSPLANKYSREKEGQAPISAVLPQGETGQERPKALLELEGTRNGIFIQNAGLVILAPFLPMIFKNLNIWVDGIWHNREGAVCLVQYLMGGSTTMEEYELVLPKLLCGLHPDDLVDPGGFLPGEKWETEANELLKSVIEYWSILKDTSVEGLRGSFLAREGKLLNKGQDWQLLVEQKPYDMLLQHLPWNISMVKLPWMEGMLYTEWIY